MRTSQCVMLPSVLGMFWLSIMQQRMCLRVPTAFFFNNSCPKTDCISLTSSYFYLYKMKPGLYLCYFRRLKMGYSVTVGAFGRVLLSFWVIFSLRLVPVTGLLQVVLQSIHCVFDRCNFYCYAGCWNFRKGHS